MSFRGSLVINSHPDGSRNGKKIERHFTLVGMVSADDKIGYWPLPESERFLHHLLANQVVAVDSSEYSHCRTWFGRQKPPKRVLVMSRNFDPPIQLRSHIELVKSEKEVIAASASNEIFVLGSLVKRFSHMAKRIVVVHVNVLAGNSHPDFLELTSGWSPHAPTETHVHVKGLLSGIIEYTRRPQPRP